MHWCDKRVIFPNKFNAFVRLFPGVLLSLKISMSSKREVTKERGSERTIVPNFHLRVSLSIVYFLGTWPPLAGKCRTLYLLYTTCIFTFMLGIFLVTEIANMFVNLRDPAKIVAGATLLMTNCTHASKVNMTADRTLIHNKQYKNIRYKYIKI